MSVPQFRRHGRLMEIMAGVWVDVTRVTVLAPPADDSDGATVWVDHRPYSVPFDPLRLAQAIGSAQLAHDRERAHEEELGRLMALDSAGVPEGEAEPLFWQDVERPFG